MEISWLGHSCFRIKGKETIVVTDPCHPSLGYSLGKVQANVVTLSHFHLGHSYVEGIAGEPRQIEGPGEYGVKDIFITGIATFHDAEQGRNRGKNTVFLLEIDGITLCHLGDLGHSLTSELIEEMGNIEVLFLPVGGLSTIGIPEATEVVRRLAPKVVIPMHYKTPVLQWGLEPIDKFLKELGIKEVTPQPKLSISRSTLPTTTQIVVLNYPQK